MSSTPKNAFVIGATGAVGRRLVNALVESKDFSRIVVFGRRSVTDFPTSDKLEQKVVDFDKIEEYKDDFKGLEVGFSAMGTTRAQTGGKQGDEYYKIDHDYVVNTAKVAKEQGVKEIAIVTARDANTNSFFAYNKLKGEIERDVLAVGFDKTVIARPGLLEARPQDADPGRAAIFSYLFKPIKMISNAWAIKCEEVAKGMIVGVLDPSLNGKVIFENADLIKKAKEFKP